MLNIRPVLTIALATAAMVGGFYMLEQQQAGISGSGPSASSGQAAIGGSFELTNQHGETVRDTDLNGQYRLVYFGFTNCPMICPTDVGNISKAMNELGDQAERVTPVFISIDPERDTPQQLTSYFSNFHPKFVALTGPQETINAVAESYKVFHAKEADDESSDGYTMNHSAFIYLMDPQGRYLSHFAHATKPEEIAAGVLAQFASAGGN